MSAKQGNVQPWRENVERVRAMISVRLKDLQSSSWASRQQSIDAALDALTTQIEELERERDEANELVGEDAGSYLFNMKAHAEKAERALAENEQAWEDMRAYNIRLEERAREAERALAEQREEMDRQLARHLCYTSEGNRRIFWREFDAALTRSAAPAGAERHLKTLVVGDES